MRDQDLERVRALPLFASMAEGTFDRLAPTSYLQRFPSGVHLISEGDEADFLHVVVEGSVELFASGNSRETTVAILRPVTAFILAAVLKDSVYLMSARTLENSRILMIPAELIRQAMEEDGAFCQAMVRELARGFRTMVKIVKNQKLRTATERLANCLLVMNEQNGSTGRIDLPFEKRLLASYLGVTPENLSRAFKTLEAYGVRNSRSTIYVDEPNDLHELAQPNALIDASEEW